MLREVDYEYDYTSIEDNKSFLKRHSDEFVRLSRTDLGEHFDEYGLAKEKLTCECGTSMNELEYVGLQAIEFGTATDILNDENIHLKAVSAHIRLFHQLGLIHPRDKNFTYSDYTLMLCYVLHCIPIYEIPKNVRYAFDDCLDCMARYMTDLEEEKLKQLHEEP